MGLWDTWYYFICIFLPNTSIYIFEAHHFYLFFQSLKTLISLIIHLGLKLEMAIQINLQGLTGLVNLVYQIVTLRTHHNITNQESPVLNIKIVVVKTEDK